MAVHTPTDRREADVAVIGGGIVGTAVALGLVRKGLAVTVFDEGDAALRASRGNFGLIWVQGKGDTCGEYADWSRLSARLWPDLAAEFADQAGVDVQLSQPGGLFICLNDDELAARTEMLGRMRDRAQGDYPFEVLDQPALKEMVPEIGPSVAGATWCPEDGHVNPLLLMRALKRGLSEVRRAHRQRPHRRSNRAP